MTKGAPPSRGPDVPAQDAPDAADRAHTSRQIRVGLKWLPVSRGIRFLITILLGKFIIPSRYALIDAAMAVIVILNVFRESGFGQAFIQRTPKSAEDDQLAADTTFYFTAFLNSTLFCIAFVIAPWIASLFRGEAGVTVEGLTNVLRAMFCLFLIDALATTPSLVLQKRLEFGRTAVAEVISTVTFAVIATVMVWLEYDVWSLVCAHLFANLVQMILMFVVSGWRPRLRFSFSVLRDMFVFGKWMWLFSALSAVGGIFDRMLLGTLRSMVDLGLYGRAFNACNMPSRQLAFLVNRVAFPALSRMKEDMDAMRNAFQKALSHIALLAIPMGCGLLSVADEFVATVFRAEYAPAGPIVEVLAFYGMALATSSVAGPVLQAIGKPKLLFFSSIVHHSLLFPLVWTLSSYGPVGVAYGVLIPMLVSTCITYGLVVKYLDMRLTVAIAPLLRAVLCGAVMVASVELFQHLVAPMSEQITGVISITERLTFPKWEMALLFSSTLFGAVVYVAASFTFNRAQSRQFLRTLKEIVFAKGR